MGKYGTDLTGFGAFEGGVNADKGAPLVSTSSDGETSLLFGPAALREIQAGCANGDFAIPPDAAGDTITEENPLPYWTFTDVNSAGAITCAVVADANAGSGSVLRWSIANATGTGKSAKISRYIPVPSSRDRAFVFIPEAFLGTRTGTNFSVTLTYSWATLDLTATGTGDSKTVSTGATLLSVDTTPLNSAAPAAAAFIYVTLTIATTGTTSGTTTQDINEIRLHRGDQGIYITDASSATYSPTIVRQSGGTLSISPDAGTGAVQLGGNLNFGTAITVVPAAQALTFTRNDTGNRANIVVARVFPGTQITRFMDDDGTYTTFSGGIDLGTTTTAVNASGGGDVQLTGADITVPISGNGELKAIPNTTTLTTNSARWVLSSGNTYALRRDSSTRRVKTNIIEADAAVLAAAKNLRAVHYEALEKDAEGNIVPSGQHTLGLIAEEIVEAGLGCAVTYDSEGLPDGYDERVLIAALLHRVNDLEDRLAALEAR